jgi:2-oxoisovalerate dehydrogenase E1 component
MSLRAAARLHEEGVDCTVLDLRWVAPLPRHDLVEHARGFRSVLVVDETRSSGGVSEGVVAALVDAGYDGTLRRVTSRDSFVPLGPASGLVLLSEVDIAAEALAMAGQADPDKVGGRRAQEDRMHEEHTARPSHRWKRGPRR